MTTCLDRCSISSESSSVPLLTSEVGTEELRDITATTFSLKMVARYGAYHDRKRKKDRPEDKINIEHSFGRTSLLWSHSAKSIRSLPWLYEP